MIRRSILFTVACAFIALFMFASSVGVCDAEDAVYAPDDDGSVDVSSEYLTTFLVDSSYDGIGQGEVIRENIYCGTDLQLFDTVYLDVQNTFNIDESLTFSVSLSSESAMPALAGTTFTAVFSCGSTVVSGSCTCGGGNSFTITVPVSVHCTDQHTYWSVTLTADRIQSSVDYSDLTVTVSATSNSYFASAENVGNQLKVQSSLTLYAGTVSGSDISLTDARVYTGDTVSPFDSVSGILSLPSYVSYHSTIGGVDYYLACGSDDSHYTVRSIGGALGNDNADITAVIIPNTVTSVGSVFSGCTGLKYINIMNSGATVSSGAFGGFLFKDPTHTDLSVTAISGNIYSVDDGVFIQSSSSLIYTYSGSNATVTSAGSEAAVSIPRFTLHSGSLYTVTSIGAAAFMNNTDIISIRFPSTVTGIGDNAFRGCSNLTGLLTISDNVLTIGDHAFDCTGIEYLNIGSGIQSIGKGAFSGCSGLEAIYIPYSTNVHIDDDAFALCAGIKYLELPSNSNFTMGSGVFGQTFYDIDKVQITSPSPSTLCSFTFTGLGSDGKLYASSHGIFFDQDDPSVIEGLTPVEDVLSLPYYSYDGTSLTAVTTINTTVIGTITGVHFTNLITTIAWYTFQNQDLESLVIPDSVTTIGKYTFGGCTGLKFVSFGSGMTSLSPDSFNGLSFYSSSGTALSVTIANLGGKMFTGTGDGSLYQPTDGIVYGLTADGTSAEVTGKASTVSGAVHIAPYCLIDGSLYKVTGIKDATSAANSVMKSTNITSVYLPDTIERIGNYAFASSSKLASVFMSEGVTEIGNNAFYMCTAMIYCEIPDTVTSIGNYAFYYCNLMSSLTLPSGLQSIGTYAFGNYGLRNSDFTVTIPDSVTYVGTNAFRSCKAGDIIMGSGMTTIPANAFTQSTITQITIGPNVQTIEDMAFNNCSMLTSVVIPASVTSIGDTAFGGTSSLTTVTFLGSSTETSDSFRGTGLNSTTVAAGTYTYDAELAVWTRVES